MSCSNGLRSLPWAGIMGKIRSNGLDVSSKKSKNPTEMKPSTESTRAVNTGGI